MCPAGRADLDERQVTSIARILIKQPLNSPEPLLNSLGVIDAVDAQSQECRFDVQLSEYRRPALARKPMPPYAVVLPAELHTDWKRSYCRKMLTPVDRKMLAVDSRFQRSIHAL